MFTDRSIKALKPKDKPYRVFEGGVDKGFGIQVTPAGGKSFFLQYAFNQKKRFMSLGTMPATSLAEARQKARDARKLLDKGLDPQEETKVVYGSVKRLFEVYRDSMIAEGKKSALEVWRSLETNALPHIGHMDAKDVESLHIRNILHNMIQRGADTHANRLRSYLHRAFQIGIHTDNDPKRAGSGVKFDIKYNPVSAVPKDPSAETEGERHLSWDELRTVWNAEITPLYHLAVKLILATGGQRSREVTASRIEEFDLEAKVWSLPPHRTKSKKRWHLIPLTNLALDIVRELIAISDGKSEFLFPGRSFPLKQCHISKTVLPNCIADYCESNGMEKWTPRDLRRTVKTRMGELGISKDIRDRIQNHSLHDVSSKHYDRYDYMKEKREALEMWCDRLEVIVSNVNVVQIRA